jgi:hypothetical protein
MSVHSASKRSRHRLKRFIEEIVSDECRLLGRGLLFMVDELAVSGSPPQRIKVWGTLHFLPLGSPFCCCEPMCHLWLFGDRAERVNDAMRRRLGLRQEVSIEFVCIRPAPHNGVEFDGQFRSLQPIRNDEDIDQRDGLGRTALMRAAMRGYDDLVEELLAAGANPLVVDYSGRGILDQLSQGQIWTIKMLEDAVAAEQNAHGGPRQSATKSIVLNSGINDHSPQSHLPQCP